MFVNIAREPRIPKTKSVSEIMANGVFKASLLGLLVLAGAASASSTNDKQPKKIEDLLAQCGMRPVAPVVPAAATLDKPKLALVKTDVQAFLSDADKYQDCLAIVIEAPDLTVMHKAHIVKLESQIQSEKEIIGGQYNQTVDAVNARLSGTPQPAVVQPASNSATAAAPAEATEGTGPAGAAAPARPTGAAVPKAKPASPAQ